MNETGGKFRLDLLLVQRELAENREEAQRLIRAGKVLVAESVVDKPGAKVDSEAPLRVAQRESRYAGRGGLKLEAALRRFQVDIAGSVVADLGASTGGFTDCLLHHGARKVFAVDVGYGQLDYRLQTDPRVVVMDRTNCRYLQAEDFGEPIDWVTADLSFISVKTVFPAIARILKAGGSALLLIKPQFEIGKGKVGKKGIVSRSEDHIQVLTECREFFLRAGWSVKGVAPSPIAGKSGNIEFLMMIADTDEASLSLMDIDQAVREAHSTESIEMVQPQSHPPIRKILILYNAEKTNAYASALEAQQYLQTAGIETRLSEHRPPKRGVEENNGTIAALAAECDVVLVLGGDGTLLGVARQIAQTPRPLLGINLGGFGFLASGSVTDLPDALAALLSGNYRLVHRFFLEAWVIRPTPEGEKRVFHALALNEALVTLSRPGRLLELWLGDETDPALAYRADGLIVATPTGSTGHSLSAGGPILEPQLAALIVTPVSPHSLFNRPLVFDGEHELCIRFREGTAELVLILDGQIHATLLSADRVHIRRSPQTIPTVSLPDLPFSRVLRHKFNLGRNPL